MHKKLEAELVSLANSILQMKNKDDVNALHKKARDIYEKLTVLRFVEDYVEKTPNLSDTEEETISTMQQEWVEKVEFESKMVVEEVEFESKMAVEIHEEAEEKEAFLEAKIEELFNEGDTIVKETAKKSYSLQISLEDEFKDAISSDIATNLFERATKENPIIEEEKVEKQEIKQRSLNDALFKNNIQVGLNDRIAFVNHLFDGSQQDFNRVVSQLNSFKTEKEAINFIKEFVKPDYDWTNKEEFEQRLINLIERKFL
ncbi:MAG: hypothetical protein A3F91_14090 [Flavobacteria bacterium RIFCSPLOWO2_12_FULL_35_11]|nr:MAG: hypothetical protein A3F91_14090 [Flavobacteria bacterium RIFCSPLOWO2_12_FULL_35_11]